MSAGDQARLRDCGMGNSLDCGLGDCGSPDDAESDYSKPVEYSQVLGPASNAKGTFQPVRCCICDGHTECFVGYVDSAAKEDSEQPGGPPASHRVLRGVENGGNPTETARDATKNASGSGDGTSVVAVGRATFGHLRPPSASRNSRVPAVDALPALLSCQMPAHDGYTAPVFAKTRMVCVLLHSRNFAY